MHFKKILPFIFCFLFSHIIQAIDETSETQESQGIYALHYNELVINNRIWNTTLSLPWKKRFIRNHHGLSELIKYADAYFNGDILTAYQQTVYTVDQETFEKLEWQQYEAELDQIRDKITFFYTGRKLNKTTFSFEAQQIYALTYHKGNLAKAFHSSRLILSDRKTIDYIDRHFRWINFPGTITDFTNTRNILYDENNKLRPEYKNLSGQIRAAKEHFSSIQNAFDIAQATNPDQYSYDLNYWIKRYIGSTESLILLLELLAEENSRLKQSNNNTKESQYAGIEGQIILGEKTGINNMLTLYNNAKSLSDVHSNKINRFLTELSSTWIRFDGSPQQFKTERSYFLNEEGKPHPDIFTMKGLAEIAEKYYNGNMQLASDTGKLFFRAYNIPSSSFLWIETRIDSETFFKERNQLYNKDGTVKDKYKYPKGLAQYAEDYHNGGMNTAYNRGRLLVNHTHSINFFDTSKDLRLQFGWASSTKMQTSKLFWKYYDILADGNGKPKKEGISITEQIKFAKKYTKGNMLDAWKIQLYVFGDRYNSYLQWIPSFKTADEVEEIIKNFFDQNGQLKERYKKQDGYLAYAEEHTDRNLNKANDHFTHLPKSIKKILNWHLFNGSIEDYKRDLSVFKQYPDMEGLIKFASEFYEYSILQAYKNVLAFFNGSKENLYKATGWLPFSGIIYPAPPFIFHDTVSYYKKIREALITENGTFNPLYKNMEGYIRFADNFYNGDMYAAYLNAKAVLETHDLESAIGWLLFKGTTVEFKKIRDFVLKYHSVESLSEKAPQHDKEIVRLFIRENKILPIYKKEYIQNVQIVLSIYRPELTYGICERGFTR